MRKFLFILVCVIITLFGGCVMEHDKDNHIPKDAIQTNVDKKDWVAGRYYHMRGNDTTIYGPVYQRYKFNEQTNVYDTVSYRDRRYRLWEHKYTAGGMREEIWYWDDKSHTWYTFNRSGDYYVYQWRIKQVVVRNGKDSGGNKEED